MSVENYNASLASNNKAKKDVITKNNNKLKLLTQKYGKEKALLIFNGKVEIGMNKEMCKESWGIPSRTDVEKTAKITKETFIYGWSKRLYFENVIYLKDHKQIFCSFRKLLKRTISIRSVVGRPSETKTVELKIEK